MEYPEVCVGEDVYPAVVSVGLGEAGDDMDVFIPVGGDEYCVSDGSAYVGDGVLVVVQEGVHEIDADGAVRVSFPDQEGPVKTEVPCHEDEGVVDGWAVVNVVACSSSAAEASGNCRVSRVAP